MSKTILDYAKQYVPSFNKNLLSAIPTEPKEAFGPIHELITQGGKRIRPTLCMLCCEALGGKPEDVLDYSILLELVHTLTLIHDDIEDFSDSPEGEILTDFWRGRTARNLGAVRQRLGRIEAGMSGSERDAAWQWFEAMPSRAKVAALCVLAG